ncbi:MAG: SIS domain-containing protein [Cyclobacteriaceae bacterium]|nr:SIS domain-containing protein [Cyclobacteriaceae bacterium SS2]
MAIEFSDISSETRSNTFKEISAQPRLWDETYEIILQQKAEIEGFLKPIIGDEQTTVILTGAGTSAYIGDVLCKVFQRNTGRLTEPIPTTDILTNPQDYFKRDQKVLLVSFARSGDSPESVGAVQLAEKLCDHVSHLIITCNKDGELAKMAGGLNACTVFMPEDSNDKALAMTGSFTSMLLAGILISDLKNLERNKAHVDLLMTHGKKMLKRGQEINDIAQLDFNRAVFLGSGPLKGIARESQLKLQELTDGQVICKYDSFLGLRHGPKAVIDKQTLVVYLLSTDSYINQYEMDLVQSINGSDDKMAEMGIGEVLNSDVSLDLTIEPGDEVRLPEEYFAVCAVLPGQLLGFYKSLALGLSPDSPSANNAINRVVQGVNIYPYK